MSTNPAYLLHLELEQTRLVAALIESEREALVHNRLPSTLEDRTPTVDVIEQTKRLIEQRHTIMRQAGFSTDLEGTIAWIRTDTDSETAMKTWGDLCQLAAKTQELNRVNGLLLERRVRVVNEQLHALECGRTGGQTYGPDGKTRSGRSVRPAVEG